MLPQESHETWNPFGGNQIVTKILHGYRCLDWPYYRVVLFPSATCHTSHATLVFSIFFIKCTFSIVLPATGPKHMVDRIRETKSETSFPGCHVPDRMSRIKFKWEKHGALYNREIVLSFRANKEVATLFCCVGRESTRCKHALLTYVNSREFCHGPLNVCMTDKIVKNATRLVWLIMIRGQRENKSLLVKGKQICL